MHPYRDVWRRLVADELPVEPELVLVLRTALVVQKVREVERKVALKHTQAVKIAPHLCP